MVIIKLFICRDWRSDRSSVQQKPDRCTVRLFHAFEEKPVEQQQKFCQQQHTINPSDSRTIYIDSNNDVNNFKFSCVWYGTRLHSVCPLGAGQCQISGALPTEGTSARMPPTLPIWHNTGTDKNGIRSSTVRNPSHRSGSIILILRVNLI